MKSTWAGFFKKLKILAPFLWPKNSTILQTRVLFCFVLLGLGRAVNLYIPIYNKKIGKINEIPPKTHFAYMFYILFQWIR